MTIRLSLKSTGALLGHITPEDLQFLNDQLSLQLAKLAVDRTNPASIAYSLTAARENARRAREIVSRSQPRIQRFR